MREETVIADGQAKAGEQPHRKKQADLDGADRAIKQQAQRDQRSEKGQHIENNEMTPLQLVKVTAPEYSIIAHLETLPIPEVKRYHSVVVCCNPKSSRAKSSRAKSCQSSFPWCIGPRQAGSWLVLAVLPSQNSDRAGYNHTRAAGTQDALDAIVAIV
jgi:hypothetical protein